MPRVCRSCCSGPPCTSGIVTVDWSLCGTTPPAPGTVALKLGSTTVATSTMDQSGTPGYTQFTGLSPGTYTVVGTQPGCATYTSSPVVITSSCNHVTESYTLSPDATHTCCDGQLVAYTYYWTDANGTIALAWNGCNWQGCGLTGSVTYYTWGNLGTCVCATVAGQVPYLVTLNCVGACGSAAPNGQVTVLYYTAQNCAQTDNYPTDWGCPVDSFPGSCPQYSRFLPTSSSVYNFTTGGLQTITFPGSPNPSAVCGAGPYTMSP